MKAGYPLGSADKRLAGSHQPGPGTQENPQNGFELAFFKT